MKQIKVGDRTITTGGRDSFALWIGFACLGFVVVVLIIGLLHWPMYEPFIPCSVFGPLGLWLVWYGMNDWVRYCKDCSEVYDFEVSTCPVCGRSSLEYTGWNSGRVAALRLKKDDERLARLAERQKAELIAMIDKALEKTEKD